MRHLFHSQPSAVLVLVLFVLAVGHTTAAIDAQGIGDIHAPDSNTRDVSKTDSRVADFSPVMAKPRPDSVVTELSTDAWYGFPSSILTEIVHAARQKSGARSKSRFTAEAALSAFLPLLKTLAHRGDFLHPDRASNITGNASKQCIHHLALSLEALLRARPWAVKMFDAWGKPGPGLVQLYGIFRGEYLECRDVQGEVTGVAWEHAQRAETLGGRKVKDAGTSAPPATPVIRGKYCHFGVSSNELPGERTQIKVPPITLGLIMDVCVPDSCSAEDLTSLVRSVYEVATLHRDPLEIDILPAQCQEKEGWRASTVVVLCLMALLMTLQKLCTAYDVIFIQRARWRRQGLREKQRAKSFDPGTVQAHPSHGSRVDLLSQEFEESGEEQDGGGPEDARVDMMGDQRPHGNKARPSEPKLSRFQQVAQTLSIYSNSELLMKSDLEPSTLTCLHGIRVLSTAWIVMGDLLVFQMVVVENSADFYFREREKMFTLIIGNYLLSVNAFFVMRLAPVMLVVGALYLGLWPLLGKGPVYPRNAPDQQACENHWFLTTLLFNNYIDIGDMVSVRVYIDIGDMVSVRTTGYLPLGNMGVWKYWSVGIWECGNTGVWEYGSVGIWECGNMGVWDYGSVGIWECGNMGVWDYGRVEIWECGLCYEGVVLFGFRLKELLVNNNYVDIGDMCLPWTWYISAEFQLYLLCPIFMIPLVKGWRRLGSLAASALVVAAMVTTGVISKLKQLPEMELQNLTDVQNYILTKPYCRMAPYIFGLLLGHAMRSNRVPRLSKIGVALGWLLCVTSVMATIFGVYRSYSHHHLTTVDAAAVYNSVKDVTFGLAVAWVIFACVSGNGGIVNTFLSWRAWVPLSRLSYCVYLVHIPVIYVFIFNLEGAVTMSEWALVVNFCGVFAISCAVSVVLHLVVERPLLALQRAVVGRMVSREVAAGGQRDES
ncbi:hypothetical protein EGW08_006099 [Elysia chlorotica]|uniref:Nose resistant-to-fluoxetine protein N-terminal domain-containing protein n=1 Tax=Elysia chlorotica TaxID=188477 RepID=A0A433TX24_ELYCH|nr:hypothetical protein EGW08_006099 [Elysia chlorotica]